MFIKNYYYYYKKLFSPEFCDYVINKGTSVVNREATVGDGKGGRKDLKMRSSNVSWITDPYILDPVKRIMEETNKKAGWNFHLGLNIDLQAQFTRYDKNQFYTWHCDCFKHQEKNRKISFTLNLSDPSAYKGGEFEFDYRDVTKSKRTEVVAQVQEKGSCLMFPSFIWHRVRPVKKGVRYSLVVWLTGENFR